MGRKGLRRGRTQTGPDADIRNPGRILRSTVGPLQTAERIENRRRASVERRGQGAETTLARKPGVSSDQLQAWTNSQSSQQWRKHHAGDTDASPGCDGTA